MSQTDAPETLWIDDEAGTDRLGRILGGLAEPDTVIGLSGPLGAGKTRLSRAIATALDVDPDAVSSPTFVLIHEYQGRIPIYHFDAYRLGNAESFECLGVSEYWNAGGVCLVEWADLVASCLPDGAWRIHIEPLGETSRRVTISGPASGRLAAAWYQAGPLL